MAIYRRLAKSVNGPNWRLVLFFTKLNARSKSCRRAMLSIDKQSRLQHNQAASTPSASAQSTGEILADSAYFDYHQSSGEGGDLAA
jgi:hypothetical protein